VFRHFRRTAPRCLPSRACLSLSLAEKLQWEEERKESEQYAVLLLVSYGGDCRECTTDSIEGFPSGKLSEVPHGLTTKSEKDK